MEYCSVNYEKGDSKFKENESIGKPYKNGTKLSCKSRNGKVFIIRIMCFEPNKIKIFMEQKNKSLINKQKIKTQS